MIVVSNRLVGSFVLCCFGIAMALWGSVFLTHPDAVFSGLLYLGIGVVMIVVGVIVAMKSKSK